MICDNCGRENGDNKICENCGSPLNAAAATTESIVFASAQGEQEIVKKRNNIKKLTNILLFIFFVFALVLSIISFFVYDVVFWLVVWLALAFYTAMFVTVIVRRKLLKRLKDKN